MTTSPECPVCQSNMAIATISPITFPRGSREDMITFACRGCSVQSNRIVPKNRAASQNAISQEQAT
jgi:hypothetical protein